MKNVQRIEINLPADLLEKINRRQVFDISLIAAQALQSVLDGGPEQQLAIAHLEITDLERKLKQIKDIILDD